MGGVNVKFTGDARSLLREQERVISKQNQMIAGMQKAGTASKQAGRGAQSWTNSLKGVAAGYLGAQTVIRGVTAALKSMHEERKKGAREAESTAAAGRSLGQISGGDPAVRGRLERLVEETRGLGVDKKAATQFVFDLHSMGMSGGRDFTAFKPVFDILSDKSQAADLVKGVSKLREGFGAEETGGTRAILSKLFRAAAGSPVSASELATPAAAAAQTVKGIGGVSDEEFLAALATAAIQTASPEVAATQIQAFAKTAQQKGATGKGIFGAVSEIEKQIAGMTKAQELKFFGRIESQKGFRVLQGIRDQAQTLETELHKVSEEAESGRGFFVEDLSAAERADPTREAAREAEVSKQKLAIQEERLGERQLRRETALREVKRRSLRRGEGGLLRAARLLVGGALESAGASAGQIVAGSGDRALLEDMHDAARENKEGAAEKRAADQSAADTPAPVIQ